MTPALKERAAAARVARLLDVFPVTVVTGARQTGKSTLCRQPGVVGERAYLTLDDVLIRDQAEREPWALIERADRLVLDEVQRVPDLLLTVKRAVDQGRVPGRFILTGSADLLLWKGITESLAGRAGYVTLWPLTRRERLGLAAVGVWSELLQNDPSAWRDLLEAGFAVEESWTEVARRGGYPFPALHLDTPEARRDWIDGYVATYLERDLRQLSAVENLADVRRLMTAMALRIGNVLSQASLARDLSVPTSNVSRYINLLEVSYQIVRVPSYAVNRTKRLVKAPKLFWSDTALALHLSGRAEPDGAYLENLVASDLFAWTSLQSTPVSILYWRTASGAEVDLVVETPSRVVPVEVTSASRVTTKDARHLEMFLDEYGDLAPAGLIVHAGSDTYWLTRRVLAAPWWRVI